MTAYAAFLRGVSPMNAKMSELKKCFEAAGFTDVKTVLSSGNVLFSTRPAWEGSLERRAESAMNDRLEHRFLTIVRRVDSLRAMLASDPYADFQPERGAKRVVTFLRENPKVTLVLPIELDGARILCIRDKEVFSSYVPNPRGPVFMGLIEKTLGEAVTTRTWDTIKKVAR